MIALWPALDLSKKAQQLGVMLISRTTLFRTSEEELAPLAAMLSVWGSDITLTDSDLPAGGSNTPLNRSLDTLQCLVVFPLQLDFFMQIPSWRAPNFMDHHWCIFKTSWNLHPDNHSFHTCALIISCCIYWCQLLISIQ